MNYPVLITVLLVAAVLIGVGSAAFLVMRSPAFWYDVGAQFVSKAWPAIVALITKRMTPEQEDKWRKSGRLPDGQDAFDRKRRGAPPKG